MTDANPQLGTFWPGEVIARVSCAFGGPLPPGYEDERYYVKGYVLQAWIADSPFGGNRYADSGLVWGGIPPSVAVGVHNPDCSRSLYAGGRAFTVIGIHGSPTWQEYVDAQFVVVSEFSGVTSRPPAPLSIVSPVAGATARPTQIVVASPVVPAVALVDLVTLDELDLGNPSFDGLTSRWTYEIEPDQFVPGRSYRVDATTAQTNCHAAGDVEVLLSYPDSVQRAWAITSTIGPRVAKRWVVRSGIASLRSRSWTIRSAVDGSPDAQVPAASAEAVLTRVKRFRARLFVDWDGAGEVEESERLAEADLLTDRDPRTGQPNPAKLTALLRNEDRRYSVSNRSSPIALALAAIERRPRVRLLAGYNGVEDEAFNGRVHEVLPDAAEGAALLTAYDPGFWWRTQAASPPGSRGVTVTLPAGVPGITIPETAIDLGGVLEAGTATGLPVLLTQTQDAGVGGFPGFIDIGATPPLHLLSFLLVGTDPDGAPLEETVALPASGSGVPRTAQSVARFGTLVSVTQLPRVQFSAPDTLAVGFGWPPSGLRVDEVARSILVASGYEDGVDFVLDECETLIPYPAASSTAPLLAHLQSLANLEGGLAYFREGKFRLWSRLRLRREQARPVLALSARAHMLTVERAPSATEVVSRVTIEFPDRVATGQPGAVVFRLGADKPVHLPGGTAEYPAFSPRPGSPVTLKVSAADPLTGRPSPPAEWGAISSLTAHASVGGVPTGEALAWFPRALPVNTAWHNAVYATFEAVGDVGYVRLQNAGQTAAVVTGLEITGKATTTGASRAISVLDTEAVGGTELVIEAMYESRADQAMDRARDELARRSAPRMRIVSPETDGIPFLLPPHVLRITDDEVQGETPAVVDAEVVRNQAQMRLSTGYTQKMALAAVPTSGYRRATAVGRLDAGDVPITFLGLGGGLVVEPFDENDAGVPLDFGSTAGPGPHGTWRAYVEGTLRERAARTAYNFGFPGTPRNVYAPAGAVEDDTAIAMFLSPTGTPTPPAGWTLLAVPAQGMWVYTGALPAGGTTSWQTSTNEAFLVLMVTFDGAATVLDDRSEAVTARTATGAPAPPYPAAGGFALPRFDAPAGGLVDLVLVGGPNTVGQYVGLGMANPPVDTYLDGSPGNTITPASGIAWVYGPGGGSWAGEPELDGDVYRQGAVSFRRTVAAGAAARMDSPDREPLDLETAWAPTDSVELFLRVDSRANLDAATEAIRLRTTEDDYWWLGWDQVEAVLGRAVRPGAWERVEVTKAGWRAEGDPDWGSITGVSVTVTANDAGPVTAWWDAATLVPTTSEDWIGNPSFADDEAGWTTEPPDGIGADEANNLERVLDTSPVAETAGEATFSSDRGSGIAYLVPRVALPGTRYRVGVWIERQSGADEYRLQIGSESRPLIGTGADVTITGTWAQFTFDWEPEAPVEDAVFVMMTDEDEAGVARITGLTIDPPFMPFFLSAKAPVTLFEVGDGPSYRAIARWGGLQAVGTHRAVAAYSGLDGERLVAIAPLDPPITKTSVETLTVEFELIAPATSLSVVDRTWTLSTAIRGGVTRTWTIRSAFREGLEASWTIRTVILSRVLREWTIRSEVSDVTLLVADAFGRSVPAGLGTADAGGAWTRYLPAGALLARDDFGTPSSGSWSDADAGGAWTVLASGTPVVARDAFDRVTVDQGWGAPTEEPGEEADYGIAGYEFVIEDAPPENPYDDLILSEAALVAYWKLDEETGTFADDRVGTNDGAYEGLVALGEPGPIASDAGGSVLLQEAVPVEGSGHVVVPYSADFDLGDAFTLEAWFRLSTATIVQSARILHKGTGGFYMTVTSDLTLAVGKGGGAANIAEADVGGVPLAAGTWYHGVWTKDGATTVIYIDGVDETGAVLDETITSTTSALYIGRFQSLSRFFPGNLARVAVYSEALSAARVLAHYTAAQA